MKTNCLQQNREQASVMLMGLMVAGIIGVTLASFLVLTQTQNASVFRSQSWNTAISVTEAGIEEGMALINKYAGSSGTASAWTNNVTGDGWTAMAGNVYYLRRFVGSNHFDVYITNQNNHPTIQSIGTVNGVSTLMGATPTTAIRGVVVTTGGSSRFSGALLVKKGITLTGTITIDSFDSRNPLYSTAGFYDPVKYKDGGDIATIETNVLAAISGSGTPQIYGHAATGPNSTVTTTGTASIGSTNWVNGGNSGVQPGWSRNDVNVVIPDATLPNTSLWSSMPGSLTYGGTNYDIYVPSGNYKSDSINMSGQNSMAVSGTVNLYLSDGISMSGQSFIYIAPYSSLTVYVGGSVSMAGQGLVNGTLNATNFTLIGLPSSTSISYSGNSDFVGTIYAPQANFSMTGGGSQLVNFVGAAVANEANINGHYSFHYDESLGATQYGGCWAYFVSSWKELPPSALQAYY
jgi:hypothetical protein